MSIHLQCADCKHLIFSPIGTPYTCPAFPDGIPNNIIFGTFIHTKKHPKQKNDILFDPKNQSEGTMYKERLHCASQKTICRLIFQN
jgi:hypothetical protein